MSVSTDDRAIYEFWDNQQRYSRLVIDTRPGGPFVIDAQSQGVPVRDIILAKNGVPIVGTSGQSGNLLFNPDNTYDVGANGANRPRFVYVATGIQIGNTPYAVIGAGAAGISMFGNLTWNTDNVQDIGAPGVNRPRNIYAANSISIADGQLTKIPGQPIVFNTAINVGSPLEFVNTGQQWFSVNAAPSAGLGNNGDFAFRQDTPGVANQRIYVKSAGAWVGIV